MVLILHVFDVKKGDLTIVTLITTLIALRLSAKERGLT